MELDEHGWAVSVAAVDVDTAWSLLSPEVDGRMDLARWSHAATRFFGAQLALAHPKTYPGGTTPLADAAWLDVSSARGGEPTRVELLTLPIDRAHFVLDRSRAAARAIGGAGFDVLVERTRRVWQIRAGAVASADDRAPLVLAAVLASVLLAPIMPPGGATIFGVKGARERLDGLGWRT
jgi:hypothetical protein